MRSFWRRDSDRKLRSEPCESGSSGNRICALVRSEDSVLKALVAAVALFGAIALAACAPSDSQVAAAQPAASLTGPHSGAAGVLEPVSLPDAGAQFNSSVTQSDLKRLQSLWHKRTKGNSEIDYPIGTGDVLEITVPDMDEIREKSVRVNGDGAVTLPLVGRLQAGGLTEDEFHDELAEKLKAYMHHPQVTVFVKQYRSRQIAVVGAVKNPGLVTLKSPSQTILDAITEAGGLTSEAADQLIFFPVEDSGEQNGERLMRASFSGAGEAVPNSAGSQSDGPSRAPRVPAGAQSLRDLVPSNAHPLLIGLKSTSLTGAGRYLQLPVRPGDVIVIPGGGDVMVVGWVERPGHFKIGSGLTVLGAIGAAGGPMYAADQSDIRLIRTQRNGDKVAIRVNIDKIIDGQEPDMSVQANDVIDVPYSSTKIGPYVFYSILTRVGYGLAIPMIP
jgi:polysaccharide export outer membrane protein